MELPRSINSAENLDFFFAGCSEGLEQLGSSEAMTPQTTQDCVHLHAGTLAGQKRKYVTFSDPLARQQKNIPTRQAGSPFEASNICANCSSIDFDAIFAQEIRDWRGTFVKDLGLVTQEWETRNCELCRLWVAIRPVIPGKEDDQEYQNFHLRAFSSMKSFVDTAGGLPRRSFPRLTDSVFLSVIITGSEKSGSRNKLSAWWKNTTRVSGFVASVPPMSPSLGPTSERYSGRLVEAKTVDYPLIRHWIGYCRSNHNRTCSTSHDSDGGSILGFRVIDCKARFLDIVKVDSKTCRYLALSYVWGPPTECHEEANGEPALRLPNHFPRVIQDAIKATKKLGYQYLWVDRYCITQNPKCDEQKKIQLIQLHSMDQVYSRASVCLIAAAGSDPSFGLPGVGGQCRIPQPCAIVGTRALVSTMPTLESEIASTIWNTRAWTYQEVILSRRRLFFTEKQVYFECNIMHCCEAVERPLDILHHNNKEQLKSGIEKPIFAPQPGNIWDVIGEYSSKRLTESDDILNGISGILRWYTRSSHPLYHVCGIPFSANRASQTELFVLNLFWQHTQLLGPCRRRADFPSWSWCGWVGEVYQKSYQLYLTGRLAEKVEVWLKVDLKELSIDGWARLETIQDALYPSSHDKRTQRTDISIQLALCHTIRIKALSMDIRLRHDLQSNEAIWLALLDHPCDRCTAIPCTRFFLTSAVDEDERFLKRLQSDKFTGLILGDEDRADLAEPYCPKVLVLDWKDEDQTIAEKIGFFSIRSTNVQSHHTCGRSFDPYSIPTSEREVILQ